MTFLSAVFSTVQTKTTGAIYGSSRYLGGGFGGLKKVGLIGVGGFVNAATFGQQYGQGASAVLTAASFVPYLGQAVMLGHGALAAIDKGNEMYRSRRQLEMHKPVQDNWGTIQMMRQESIRRLSQDKSAMGRMIGNEAQRFARR